MRVKSLLDIPNMSASTPQGKQLKAALAEYEKDSRERSAKTSHGRGQKRSAPRVMREPQEILSGMVRADDELGRLGWVDDFVGAVPGRRFEIDLAIPSLKLGVETDGWQYHGRHKESFLRDRDKDYLLSVQGWVVVRVQAGLISTDPQDAMARVRRFLQAWIPRQRALLARES